MPMHSSKKLPDLDLSEPIKVTYALRPETKAYLASVAAGNHVSETAVVHLAIGVLRGLGQLGVKDHLVVPPITEGGLSTRILLGIDPTRAAFSVEQYQELHAAQQIS